MLIQSGIDMNLNISVLDPQPKAPCHQIASQFTCGSITDFETVYQFGKSCDLISIEIENVNIEALARLEQEDKKVFPQPDFSQNGKPIRLEGKLPPAQLDFGLQ